MITLKQKFVRSSLALSVILLGTLLPFLANAQGPTTRAVELKNPLKVDSITGLLEALLSVVIVLATPIIIFFIIYSGFLYVTARGNASQIEQASRSLTYAIIGGVIIIGAMAIATIVKNLVDAF